LFLMLKLFETHSFYFVINYGHIKDMSINSPSLYNKLEGSDFCSKGGKGMEKNALSSDVGVEVKRKGSLLKYIGPAFITSALMLGPGSLTLSSKIGAIYGSQLVWSIIAAIVLMMSYTEMSTRIGLAGKDSFIGIMLSKWGRVAAVLIGLGAFAVTSSFQAGNAIGTGIALNALTGVSEKVW